MELFTSVLQVSSRYNGLEGHTGQMLQRLKLGPHDVWYVFVVHHVWMCQKDSSNQTHTDCFDVSIYLPIGKPDVANERMTHLLKLDTFFHRHDARIMTHDASQMRTTHCVDLPLLISAYGKKEGKKKTFRTNFISTNLVVVYMFIFVYNLHLAMPSRCFS